VFKASNDLFNAAIAASSAFIQIQNSKKRKIFSKRGKLTGISNQSR
jgi:hypothetical protein